MPTHLLAITEIINTAAGYINWFNTGNPQWTTPLLTSDIHLIKDLLDTFNGDTEKAILAYYQGAGGARTLLKQGKTDKDGYVAKVMSYFKEYKKCFTNT